MVRKRLHLRRGRAADNGEGDMGELRAQLRHHGRRKTFDRLDIRPVIHLSRKDDQRAGRSVGQRRDVRRLRIKAIEIDAVANRLYSLRPAAPTEQRRFRRAYEQVGTRALRYSSLIICEQPRLSPVDPGHRPASLGAVTLKLRTIDVDEVHYDAARKALGHILRHLAGKDVDRLDPLSLHQPRDPAFHRRRIERCERDRASARQRSQSRLPHRYRAGFEDRGRGHCLQCFGIFPVVQLIDERRDVDGRTLRHPAQHMVRPDFVTAIGRPGHAVRDVEDAHPSPLAIHGPIRLATGSGSFCQVSTIMQYFGLLGFTSRPCPSALQLA